MKPDSSRTPDPTSPISPLTPPANRLPLRLKATIGAEEMIPDYPDADVQNRLWLKAVISLLQLRSHETDPSGRVQFAFDQMYVAASESPASSSATFRLARADCRTSPRVARRRGGRLPISRKTPGIISQRSNRGRRPTQPVPHRCGTYE